MKFCSKPILMENRLLSRILTGSLVVVFLLVFAGKACAQHIPLSNPSLEGTSSGVSKVPKGWIKVAGTPDILPGVYNIGNQASDGKHYEGLHSGPAKMEAIGQQLPDSLKAGLMYKVSFDMAYVLKYLYENCYANLAIFGGDTPTDSTELLWMSGIFTHQDWKRYEAVFTPSRSYKYISFWAYPTDPCIKTEVGVALLIDNFSPTIQQIVKAETSSTPSCNTENTGTAGIRLTGAAQPVSYQWTPGNYTTASIQNVPAGVYQVTATAANGIVVTEQITVGGSDLTASAKVTTSSCYNDNESQIKLSVSGGMPPYRYTLNGHPADTPVIDHVKPGDYTLIVSDQQVCADTFALKVQPPPPLSVHTAALPLACGADSSGQFTAHAAGGAPPYLYRMNGGTWQADSVFRRLSIGDYQYEVKDDNDCTVSGQAIIQVDPALAPVVNVTVKPASCNEALNGELVVSVERGKPPFVYRINNGEWQTENVFSRLPPGSYHYEVADASQCTVSGTVTLTSPFQNCLVVMPSAFSPNKDGNNDVFRPKVYDDIHDYHIRIYNRWGQVIYEGNDPGTGWDGVYKGAPQDPQTFIYIAYYTDRKNVRHDLKGTVTLVR
jgi:gliding motility-associated-like protein